MKKLMLAAVAAAAAGGAFASPLVYDYKASVKHMYEKEHRNGNATVYVKYVKTSKLQGYFVQDFDATTLLANTELAGAAVSQKKGFLVLINKSAEKDFRAPKIMPAQLDVKTATTSITGGGSTVKTKVVAEAYFYAGPFAAFPDANNPWDAAYDDGADYMFNNGAANGAAGVRAYGTVGSTLYLFGQHNTYNRFYNAGTLPAGSILAFGDAWMNGAGFGKGSGTTSLCCGWGAVDGGFGAISGNLKGGLFLCSISGYPANTVLGYFALGLEDVFKSDVGAANLAKTVQGDNAAVVDDPADEVTWADGDIALSTTDVVSGTWTLKPAARLSPVEVTGAESAFFPSWPACQEVGEYIKGACRALDRNYNLTTATEPSAANGKKTQGLISTNFGALYL
jgi:hypothetical protein